MVPLSRWKLLLLLQHLNGNPTQHNLMFIQLKPKFFTCELEQSEISTRISSLNMTASRTGRLKTGGTSANGYIRQEVGVYLSFEEKRETVDVSTWSGCCVGSLTIFYFLKLFSRAFMF